MTDEDSTFRAYVAFGVVVIVVTALGVLWYFNHNTPPPCNDSHTGITAHTVFDCSSSPIGETK